MKSVICKFRPTVRLSRSLGAKKFGRLVGVVIAVTPCGRATPRSPEFSRRETRRRWSCSANAVDRRGTPEDCYNRFLFALVVRRQGFSGGIIAKLVLAEQTVDRRSALGLGNVWRQPRLLASLDAHRACTSSKRRIRQRSPP